MKTIVEELNSIFDRVVNVDCVEKGLDLKVIMQAFSGEIGTKFNPTKTKLRKSSTLDFKLRYRSAVARSIALTAPKMRHLKCGKIIFGPIALLQYFTGYSSTGLKDHTSIKFEKKLFTKQLVNTLLFFLTRKNT